MKKIFIFFVITFIFSIQANAKDLSGNAINCLDTVTDDENTLFHSQATILFTEKNKANFAISGFKTVSGEIELFEILIPGEVVNYKVLEKKIVLKVDRIKNVYDPYGRWRRLLKPSLKKEIAGQIWIWRETLDMTNLAYFDGIKCDLVDANDPKLFDMYRKHQIMLDKMLQKQKEESESRNIL